MIGLQRIEVAGQRFVLVEEGEYERLCAKASETVPLDDEGLPPLPKPDKQGRFPALEYARVSLARDVIRDRRVAGLTQQQLAELAGTRQETISRIESGTYTASHKLVERIDRAIKSAKKTKVGVRKRR
jgi:DNA-binding XRE family transcriptional regulator